ncbi:MAG: SPOR domain-containing protein [Bacteroidales bacterium]|nr:SPOR domain-containing protein [Bacteroidales bacterium]
MNLASSIKELILLNEGVILPGFGGFITKYHPAEIRKNTNMFEPPSVEIIFSSNMIADNGLLVSHVARKNNLTDEKAQSVVHDYIENLKRELQEKGSVLIDDLGRFTKSPEGNISFIARADKNFLIQSFGLPAVEIAPPPKPPEIQPRKMPPPVASVIRKKRKRIPVAASILFLFIVGAGAVYFTGIFDTYIKPLFSNTGLAVTDKHPNDETVVFGQQVPVTLDTSAMEINRQLMEKSSKEKALYYHEPEKTEQQKPGITTQKTEPEVTYTPAIQSGKFHVVAGSFLIPGNAERQKSKLEIKGYSPTIVRKNDEFFYVSLQSFESKEAAKAEMQRLNTKLDIPLWVMSQ